MFLMVLFAVICTVFIMLLRKRRRVLSAIIAVECAVLVLLFFILSLSASGVIFMQAFTRKVSVYGLNISSVTLLTAVLLLMTVFVALSALLHIVKKLRCNKPLRQYCREHYEVFKARVFSVSGRRLLLLHCRLND